MPKLTPKPKSEPKSEPPKPKSELPPEPKSDPKSIKLTPLIFLTSLKWHEGPPPFFHQPANSQTGYNETIYDPKVVAIKDDLGNFFITGQLNHNLCAGMCPNCLETHNPHSKYATHNPCVKTAEIVAWAEFF